jgi:putative solute:sodium symporter small subunit
VEEPRPAQPRPAQPRPAQPRPAQRQLVVWRGDQAPVQHDIPGPGDLRDDTNTGRVLIGSLVRAQLGLSLMCLVLTLTVTVSFPVLAALVPAVGRMRVAGLPITLIVLGFGFYPVFLAIGWFYNRQARQLEARFTDLVKPPR